MMKVAQQLLEKTKTLFGLMLKYENCTTKVRFLSILVQFCGVISFAKKLSNQLKPKQCNEPIKLLNDLLHPRHSSQSSVNLGKRRAAQLLSSCFHDLPQGGGFGSFFIGNIVKYERRPI